MGAQNSPQDNCTQLNENDVVNIFFVIILNFATTMSSLN